MTIEQLPGNRKHHCGPELLFTVCGGMEWGCSGINSDIRLDLFRRKDHFQPNIKVTKNGLTPNIALETLDTSTLSGQMVNVLGTPMPNFTMVLQTKETCYYNQRVLGGSARQFEIECPGRSAAPSD